MSGDHGSLAAAQSVSLNPSAAPAASSSSPAPAAAASSEALPELMNTFNAREDLLHLFFHLLWMKQGNGNHHALTGVNIPDTVMTNHSRPIHWYFTSKDGSIKMKTKKSLASRTIIEHLTGKKRLSCSGSCYWLISREVRGVDENVTMSGGTPQQLQAALADGSTTGLLQTFVDPRAEAMAGRQNAIIMANWTPNVLYLEKRHNTLDMRADGSARAHPLDERTTLSEQSRFVRVVPLVSSHTTAVLERLCGSIAHHIELLNGVSVTNLVLHVKLDEANQPWVLYCSSIRVMHLTPKCEPVSATLSVTYAQSSTTGQRSRSAHAAPSPSRQASVLSGQRPADDDRAEVEAAPGGKLRRRRNSASSAPHGGQSRTSSISRTSDATARLEAHDCTLCHELAEGENLSFVARQHVLFPLSVIEFFNAHPPGSVYSDAPVREGVVPPAFSLVVPGITWDRYLARRHDMVWLDERVPLCDACAAGLESVTANLHIDEDGAIRVPASSSNPLAASHQPQQRQPVRVQLHSEQRAAARKHNMEERAARAAAGGGSPPPPQQSQLPPLVPRRSSPQPV